jgi:hypothetical protein
MRRPIYAVTINLALVLNARHPIMEKIGSYFFVGMGTH